ncbi:MAG: 6-phosphofructokinase, partial [Phycisphaerales bacterium]
RQHDDDGPHLIYVPEAAFDVDQFKADVAEVYGRLGRCLIAVSEGIHDHDDTPIMTKLAASIEEDAHGNVQLSGIGALGDHLANVLRDHLGKDIRVRADTFGYLQRCFAGCVSQTDAHEARLAGRKAAELALAGEHDGSIAIQRVSNSPYEVEYKRIELSDVAAKTQTLDPKYIVHGNNIDPSFRDYLSPLVGELPVVELLRVR